jgi:hypothetical protein
MTQDLYGLLPALYRLRDAETGGALRGLLSVLGSQADVLDGDILQLYDNWFIETCDESIATYLGDLLGVRPLHDVGNGVAGTRAYVANTIGYRRRKGTAAVLEQLALDVAGWPARAVEFFTRLAATEHLNHRRPGLPGILSLRGAADLELLNGPFERAAHTAQARDADRAGRYAIRTVGVFVWRLAAFMVERGTARPVVSPADGRYHANPIGLDMPLFNPGRRESEITHLAVERDVPAPLRRRPLHAELEGLRAGSAPAADAWFSGEPVLRLFLDGVEVPPANLSICDLNDWRRPTASGIRAAIDPVLGRVALPAGGQPDQIEISCAYGFSGLVGGGPYDRTGTLADPVLQRATFAAGVSAHRVGAGISSTFAEAVQQWADQPPGTVGVIALLDSASHLVTVTVEVPAGSALFVLAAHLPDGAPLEPDRLIYSEVRPHLLGDLILTATAGVPGGAAGRCTLSGVLVEGAVTAAGLGALTVSHSTVVPGRQTSVTAPLDQPLTVVLDRSITGELAFTGDVDLRITDCIVDGSVQAPDGDADLSSSTVLGTISVRRLSASDSLLTDVSTAERRQDGCVRFSYVAPGSTTPRRHRCQPDLSGSPPPSFTSERYGDPGYAQLTGDGPLATGGSDGSEMGAFAHLRQPQREENLRVSLAESLPAGLTAGIIRVT